MKQIFTIGDPFGLKHTIIRKRVCIFSPFVRMSGKRCLETIKDGELLLNDCGRVAHNEWLKTAQIRENIVLHDFVVMPNHLHGIVEIQAGRMPCAPRSETWCVVINPL